MEPEGRGGAGDMDQNAQAVSSEAGPERKFRLPGSNEKISFDKYYFNLYYSNVDKTKEDRLC
jgi:hypothetical protein